MNTKNLYIVLLITFFLNFFELFAQGNPQRGAYIFHASGGCSCHTEKKSGQHLAGGRGHKTPFGTVYSTNITPDRETGIGKWTFVDFKKAMKEGISPSGEHYYPVFPYTSFYAMKDQDLHDLFAYLMTLKPINKKNKENSLLAPFRLRAALAGWKKLNFQTGNLTYESNKNNSYNRGKYLVEAVAHCAECHTDRGYSGGLKQNERHAGTKNGPEGEKSPNITPDSETGIGKWSRADLIYYLKSGILPDGDSAQGVMAEVIDEGYSKLTDADLSAIADYIMALPPKKKKIK